jgi:hypothetical protein
MQKSAKELATFENMRVFNREVFHTKGEGKSEEVYWYSMDMEQSFLIPGIRSFHEYIYVHNFKVYYNTADKFVELEVLTGKTRELCDTITSLNEAQFEYPYMIARCTFINVETGVILASRNALKRVRAHGHGLAVVVNITSMTLNPSNNKNNTQFTVSLHNLSDFKVLYTSQPRCITTPQYESVDTTRNTALIDAANSVPASIINENAVRIGNSIIKVREKTTTKPKCKVCHKKLVKCGVVLPCKHCSFHYECIGDIGSKCPQCDGTIADKINTA